MGVVHGEEMVLNIGPQHPATHGVLRLQVRTDGEVVSQITPYMGYLHRCFEKHSENVTYEQVIPFTDRCDYLSSRSCLLYTSPSPRDATLSRMPSSA